MAARREILKGMGVLAGAAGLGLLTFRDRDGREHRLGAADARAQGMPVTGLTAAETATLEALGETLVPGAREAGVAHFVDAHLKAEPAQSLLMIRYLDVPPPWLPFYRAGLAAVDGLAQARLARPFAKLDAAGQAELVRAFAAEQPPEWRGPPSPLFYFVARADAVDVVYGTEQGFERLGIPYMAHIAPETPW